MKLPVPLRNDLAELVLLCLRKIIDIDAVEESFSQDLLHKLGFIQTVARAGPAVRGTD
jgi:hypothetical protein